MISQINVVVLYVEDQDRMHRFFVDQLGFETVTDAEMWPGARWLEVRPPGAETGLVLSRATDFQRDADTAYPATFTCQDIRATAQRYAENEVPVSDVVEEPWGTYIRVTDPEGREFLVAERA
jgi:lactoylglutathione lyase